MDRTQFTFYESFFRAISRIRKKADRADAYDAICAYALYGTEPDLDALPDASAIAFDLIRPNLDASRRKANSGKSGGTAMQIVSKPEANRKQARSKPEASEKQTGSKKESEKEIEKEIEIENECYYPPPPTDPALADVMSDFLNRINPTAPQFCLEELAGYVKTVGPDVCKRAFDVALAEKKTTWSYIQAILADKQARGVKCLADWDAAEERRERQRGTDHNSNAAPAHGGVARKDWGLKSIFDEPG